MNATTSGELMSSEHLEILPELNDIKKQVADEVPKVELDPELEKQANEVVEHLINVDPAAIEHSQAAKQAVETMGAEAQHQSAQLSDMLTAPVNSMSKRSEDGGEVANALVNLKLQVEELDPARFDFEPGWFSRMLGHIPGVGTPIKRYFTKFESGKTVIDAIKGSLVHGKDQLKRDNTTLLADQKKMREATQRLEKAIKLGQAIDEKLSGRIAALPDADTRKKFLAEEVLFALRQRLQDLQQTLVVNQQGIVAMEIIMRNNKELIRGVERTVNVTVNALSVGATLAIALADQKVVLDKVNAVTDTTNQLIANTAKMLREQGTEIHKQAASTALDMNVLKQAFTDIRAALDDIATFRHDALPKMARAVVELEGMSRQQEAVIRQLEEGNRVGSTFRIDVS